MADRPAPNTQTGRILAALEDGPLCGFAPLRWDPPITRTAARILELKAAGWHISADPCRLHGHTGKRPQLYVLTAATPGQAALW
jgi:hypothetical protein